VLINESCTTYIDIGNLQPIFTYYKIKLLYHAQTTLASAAHRIQKLPGFCYDHNFLDVAGQIVENIVSFNLPWWKHLTKVY